MLQLITTVHEIIVDNKVALSVSIAVGVKLLEHTDVQIQPSVGALVYYSHRFLCVCPCVRHLHACSYNLFTSHLIYFSS